MQPKLGNKTKPMPTVFDEQAALASLAKVKSPEDVKRELFHVCLNFVQKAREKNISWENIAETIFEHGGPKLTGIEVGKFFQDDGRVDPSPRAARKATRRKPVSPVTAALASASMSTRQESEGDGV